MNISIYMPAGDIKTVRRAAKADSRSVSSFISLAVRNQIRMDEKAKANESKAN